MFTMAFFAVRRRSHGRRCHCGRRCGRRVIGLSVATQISLLSLGCVYVPRKKVSFFCFIFHSSNVLMYTNEQSASSLSDVYSGVENNRDTILNDGNIYMSHVRIW